MYYEDEPGRRTAAGLLTRDEARRVAAGFQVANSLNRFAVSSWMPFKYDDDGSLVLYFQNESPGADMEANWLPTPNGPFNLTMRLYAPRMEALTGKWSPPPVTKDYPPNWNEAKPERANMTPKGRRQQRLNGAPWQLVGDGGWVDRRTHQGTKAAEKAAWLTKS
jgi:hypothetical protein